MKNLVRTQDNRLISEELIDLIYVNVEEGKLTMRLKLTGGEEVDYLEHQFPIDKFTDVNFLAQMASVSFRMFLQINKEATLEIEKILELVIKGYELGE